MTIDPLREFLGCCAVMNLLIITNRDDTNSPLPNPLPASGERG